MSSPLLPPLPGKVGPSNMEMVKQEQNFNLHTTNRLRTITQEGKEDFDESLRGKQEGKEDFDESLRNQTQKSKPNRSSGGELCLKVMSEKEQSVHILLAFIFNQFNVTDLIVCFLHPPRPPRPPRPPQTRTTLFLMGVDFNHTHTHTKHTHTH